MSEVYFSAVFTLAINFDKKSKSEKNEVGGGGGGRGAAVSAAESQLTVRYTDRLSENK